MNKNFLKNVFAWIIGILFIIAGTYIFMYAFKGKIAEEYLDIYKNHFSAIVGLPAAAFIATFLIVILKISEKDPIEFSILKISFKGASSEIVLWVFVYMSIVLSIKLLW